jgi:leucyl aminopeptidase
MDIIIDTTSPKDIRTGVLVVGAFTDGPLLPSTRAIDDASKGKLSELIKRGDLETKAGASLMLYDVPGTAAERVLLVSLGTRDEFGDKGFRDALSGASKALASGAAKDAAVTLTDLELPGRSLAWRLEQASRILADGAYRFDAPGTRRTQQQDRGARKISLLVADKATPELEQAVRRGQAVAEGMALTKDLGNLGGNVCNPAYLAQMAQAMGQEFKFAVDVLEREDMEKLGMGSALSVGRASHFPCKFIVMHYRGGEATAKPIVLVGKGITFDTGGISLKPGADLDEMKYDMSGGGTVFGVVKTIARLALPINLIGIVPAVENMPGGNATRPGDVVTSMSGQTIEILNTDAEGRLVLCDALTYAERFAPACVIDIATLTGACVIALGSVTSAVFANDEALAAELLQSGVDTGDRAWQMPLFDEYQTQLKSNFADMANIGGRPAGAITAACFLARFTKAYTWAHLDIAGTASVSGDAKGATGRPVPLLSDFLIRRAGAQAVLSAGV